MPPPLEAIQIKGRRASSRASRQASVARSASGKPHRSCSGSRNGTSAAAGGCTHCVGRPSSLHEARAQGLMASDEARQRRAECRLHERPAEAEVEELDIGTIARLPLLQEP